MPLNSSLSPVKILSLILLLNYDNLKVSLLYLLAKYGGTYMGRRNVFLHNSSNHLDMNVGYKTRHLLLYGWFSFYPDSKADSVLLLTLSRIHTKQAKSPSLNLYLWTEVSNVKMLSTLPTIQTLHTPTSLYPISQINSCLVDLRKKLLISI